MPYLWVLLSLASAFCLATSDALTKKALDGENEYLAATARLIFTLPPLLLLLPFTSVPALDRSFIIAFSAALPIEIITVILYVRALKVSPLSLTLPFLALTPVFLIGSSYFISGEKVSLPGGIGISAIALGGYVLNLDKSKYGILEPIRAVLREKGSVYMIIVAALYSITSSLGKVCVEHSSPLFFGITYFTSLTCLMVPVALWMGRGEIRYFTERKRYLSFVLPGIFYALMIVTHMHAIKLVNVAYMVSIKRTSLLIGVIYGYFFFSERDIRQRFVGAALMFAGFLVIMNAK